MRKYMGRMIREIKHMIWDVILKKDTGHNRITNTGMIWDII